jgi:hypothetical protein
MIYRNPAKIPVWQKICQSIPLNLHFSLVWIKQRKVSSHPHTTLFSHFLCYTTSCLIMFYRLHIWMQEICAVHTYTNVRKTKFSLWFKKSKMEQKYFEFRGYIKLTPLRKVCLRWQKHLKDGKKKKYLGKCTMLRDEVWNACFSVLDPLSLVNTPSQPKNGKNNHMQNISFSSCTVICWYLPGNALQGSH